jgi:hypothetical protein
MYAFQTRPTRAAAEIAMAVGLTGVDRKSPGQNIDALVVGLGGTYLSMHNRTAQNADIFDLGSSFQPFMIAALCESMNIDYRMTLVDKDPGIIKLVQEQEELRIPMQDVECGMGNGCEECVFSTNVFEKYVHAAGVGSEVKVGRALTAVNINGTAGEGFVDVLCAPIPASFKQKREQGLIRFETQDVATMELSSRYDIAVCTNVLLYLTQENMAVPINTLPEEWRNVRVVGRPELASKTLVNLSGDVAGLYNVLRHTRRGGFDILSYFSQRELPLMGVEDLTRAINPGVCSSDKGVPRILQRKGGETAWRIVAPYILTNGEHVVHLKD